MEKDKVANWQDRIYETFQESSGIVGERLLKLRDVEVQLTQDLLGRFHGYVNLMDAFLDFYIETLQKSAARRDSKWPEITPVFTAIQIASFWRFRASYLIFWDGYFIDAVSLLRAIFENVLQIAALKLRIITIDDVFGKLKTNQSKKLSEEKIHKIIRKHVFASDKIVYSQMIGEHSGLSPEAIKKFRVFVRLLHNSVHKSKLNLLLYYGPWLRGERSLPIFPKYDEDPASLYTNMSLFIGWMVVRTLPLLQIYDSEFSDNWYKKYQILDESFQEAVADFPKRLGRSVEELIASKFDFGYHK